MGGTLKAKSQLGAGSLFEFTAELEVQGDSAQLDYRVPVDMKGLRVLVVDDNHSSTTILATILEGLGFLPHAVHSGEEAIVEIRRCQQGFEKPYQLVLMDMMMPGLDGIDTATRILGDNDLPSPPTIMMVTAHGQEDIRLRARTAGLQGFMVKPVNSSVVFDTIMSTMGRTPSLRQSSIADIPEPPRGLKGSRVLVVEDQPANQHVAEEILSQAGIVVSLAANGKQAVEMVDQATKRFHLVLMDLQMPVMDGHAATARLRSRYDAKELPIVAMTANIMASEKEKCLASGMNEYFSKPIDVKALYQMLDRWIPGNREGVLIEPVEPADEAIPPVLARSPEPEADLQIPGIQMQEVLARLGGNTALFGRLISQFTGRYKDGASELRSALLSSDGKAIADLAHGLVGVAGSLGATDISETARTLEEAGAGRRFDQAAKILGLLDKQLVTLATAVENSHLQQPEERNDATDGKSLAALFSVLDSRLGANDFGADASWQDLRPRLVQTAVDKDLFLMDELLARLDFESAKAALAEYAKTLGIAL